METVANEIILIGAVILALGNIISAAVAIVKWRDKKKKEKEKTAQLDEKQDEAIKELKKEQTLLCYAVTACLDGLHQQGCNGQVTDALNRMSKYLNQQAHK